MKSYLIVANKTLAEPRLLDEVTARASAEPSRFHVVVPATPGPHGAHNWTEGQAHKQAQERLDQLLARFREAGIEVTSEIGDENPLLAVGDCFQREQYDLVIVSTLPSGKSKWLKLDLPHRIASRFHVPVAHVVASEPAIP